MNSISKIEPTEEQQQIRQLHELLARGQQCIIEAGKLVAAMVDRNPRVFETINQSSPHLSLNLLANLERVGRGLLHGALLFDGSPGARRLLAMPAAAQRKLYVTKFKVVSLVDKKPTLQEKPIQKLTPTEVRRVFTPDNKVRSVDEQLQQLKGQPVPAPVVVPRRRYELRDDKLVVFTYAEFTAATLEYILIELKRRSIAGLRDEIISRQITRPPSLTARPSAADPS